MSWGNFHKHLEVSHVSYYYWLFIFLVYYLSCTFNLARLVAPTKGALILLCLRRILYSNEVIYSFYCLITDICDLRGCFFYVEILRKRCWIELLHDAVNSGLLVDHCIRVCYKSFLYAEIDRESKLAKNQIRFGFNLSIIWEEFSIDFESFELGLQRKLFIQYLNSWVEQQDSNFLVRWENLPDRGRGHVNVSCPV